MPPRKCRKTRLKQSAKLDTENETRHGSRHEQPMMDNTRQIKQVTGIGLAVNVSLSLLKLVGGIVGRSHAVIADAVHSLSDTATDLAILIGVHYWSAPPDESHPHGHHRIETLVTAIIGVVLAGVAVGLVYDAVSSIHGPSQAPPEWLAFWVAVASIFIKEALYRYTVSTGRKIGSSAVIANAWHQRSDMLSSIPAAVAVLGARFLPDWQFLDAIGALVVSLLILRAAWHIMLPALNQLTDSGAPPEECRKIHDIAFDVAGVRHVHDIRTRYLGSGLSVDLHVEVDGEMSVLEGHELSMMVKHALLQHGPCIKDVVVHLEPEGDHLNDQKRCGKHPGS